MPNLATLNTLPFPEIVGLIRADWKKVYFGAVPYLQAMQTMDEADSAYGAESGHSIIRYFLSNATTWKGDTARAVKKELKRRIGDK